VVLIGVDAPQKEEADRCLREAFPDSDGLYEICDPWESSYQPGSDSASPRRGCQLSQPELSPSTTIGCEGKFFLFSGAVVNCERGLTVAHATNPEKEIVLDPSHGSSAGDRPATIGRCLETYDNLQRQNGDKLSADLALLKLNSRVCSVDNTVRWPFPSGRTLQIKIYKGQKVPDDTRVMILDQNGDFQYGTIRRDHLTDMRLKSRDLHDVLAISTKKGWNEVTITQSGDSGALVMSHPSNDSDVVNVYGIVNAIYTEPTNDRSLTIANSLWDVLHELCTNHKYHTALQNNNTGDDIDFV